MAREGAELGRRSVAWESDLWRVSLSIVPLFFFSSQKKNSIFFFFLYRKIHLPNSLSPHDPNQEKRKEGKKREKSEIERNQKERVSLDCPYQKKVLLWEREKSKNTFNWIIRLF